MKLFHEILFIILLITISNALYAQKKRKNHPLEDINCPITQSELLLDGKHFVNVPPIFLRVYNESYEYATLQLGKRKRNVFLFFKIFTDNTCIKQEEPLEFYFENGEILSLKNQFQVNCEGNLVVELCSKEIKKITSHMINKIKLFTLNNDYEFNPTDADNKVLREYLTCFKYYKVKNN